MSVVRAINKDAAKEIARLRGRLSNDRTEAFKLLEQYGDQLFMDFHPLYDFLYSVGE